MGTFFSCPTCGNSKTDDRVYRCSKCGKLICESCGNYHCPHCDTAVGWRDEVGRLG